jgi:hypothetical protein
MYGLAMFGFVLEVGLAAENPWGRMVLISGGDGGWPWITQGNQVVFRGEVALELKLKQRDEE